MGLKMLPARALCLVIILLVPGALASPLDSTKLINFTISAPNGTQNHNNPKQICKPPKLIDYLTFYFGNYFAHIATVQIYPGESLLSTLQTLVLALFFPASGTIRGLTAIFRCAILQKTPLQKAARSGALCMVVRSAGWVPPSGYQLKGLILGPIINQKPEHFRWLKNKLRMRKKEPAKLSDTQLNGSVGNLSRTDTPETRYQIKIYRPLWARELSRLWSFYDTSDEQVRSDRSVHGFYVLSPGYALAHVPRDTVVGPLPRLPATDHSLAKDPSSHEISTNYSFPKTFIAVVQLVFASYTLYDAVETQIDTYGYAAFGLTVTPYALMSLINLVGGLLTPSHPCLFIVHSSIMDEAIEAGSHFDGVVGTLHDYEMPGGLGNGYREGVFVRDSELQLRDLNPQCQLDESSAITQEQIIRIQPVTLRPEGTGSSTDPVLYIPSGSCFERQKKHTYAASNLSKARFERIPGKAEGGLRCEDDDEGEGSAIMITILISAISFAVIGILSGFRAQKGTLTQRVFTITWLSVGLYVGSYVDTFIEALFQFHRVISPKWSLSTSYLLAKLEGISAPIPVWVIELVDIAIKRMLTACHVLFTLMSYAIYFIPAIGGLIVVGVMMDEFGVCTEL